MSQIAKFILYKNGVITRKVSFQENDTATVTIGTSSSAEPVDFELDSNLISTEHASISGDGYGNLFLIDKGSMNGTFLNGVRIPPNENILIEPGVTITFANDQQYQLYAEPSIVAQKTSKPSAPDTSHDHKSSIMELLQTRDTIIIGRGTECDLVIADDTVSRQHARITRTGSKTFIITDLNSTNGTYINGCKFHDSVDLHTNDIILIGDFRLSLTGATRDIRTEIAIRTENIIKQYKNGYLGLQETSISIPAHELIAIMGPSGCGKSTLMKTLNGDDPCTNGRVFIHGLELASNYEYLKPRIGYVPQDDIVHMKLTVEQSLFYAAKLRMGSPDKSVIDAKIDQILHSLNIQHIRHIKIDSISGGQRKRVSIAVELLTDPLILFLDEPTSPLDPQTIEEFMDILRHLSTKGTTVILVTHKPEDLNYMDQVIFMAEGGHLVYYGSTNQYKDYFNVTTAVEVYADISGTNADRWVQQFQSRTDNQKQPEPLPPSHIHKLKTSSLLQLYWLSRRYLNIKINDRLNTFILLAQAPVIALLLSLIFQNISPAVPFLVAISAIWFGVSNAAREIVSELPVYRRERMFNLKIAPYILSKLSVLTLFSTIQATLLVGILYLRFSDTISSGSDPVWNNPVATILWTILLSVSASMMGLLLSAIMSTTEKVMTLVPIILIPQIILAGFITKISSWGIEIVSWLTLARWGTEGLHIIQEKVYTTQIIINTTKNSKGQIISSTTQAQGKATDALQNLTHFFMENYRNKSIFGELTGTLTLDSIFIAGLGVLFFFLTWISLRKKDTL